MYIYSCADAMSTAKILRVPFFPFPCIILTRIVVLCIHYSLFPQRAIYIFLMCLIRVNQYPLFHRVRIQLSSRFIDLLKTMPLRGDPHDYRDLILISIFYGTMKIIGWSPSPVCVPGQLHQLLTKCRLLTLIYCWELIKSIYLFVNYIVLSVYILRIIGMFVGAVRPRFLPSKHACPLRIGGHIRIFEIRRTALSVYKTNLLI